MISRTPTLLLACDLSKSGGKFFYKLPQGQTHALWMEAEVAHALHLVPPMLLKADVRRTMPGFVSAMN